MFSGIVCHLGKIVSINPPSSDQNKSTDPDSGYNIDIVIDNRDFFNDLSLGSSICIDGVCLTACEISKKNMSIRFNLSTETIENTTLGKLCANQLVHCERALTVGAENGGHNISGHVDGICKLIDKSVGKYTDRYYRFKLLDDFKDYIINCGYISLSGVSLTLKKCDRDNGEFSVNLVKHTLNNTHFLHAKINDIYNFELDHITRVIVSSTRHLLTNNSK